MNDWIKISHELPDPYEYVLVGSKKQTTEPFSISIARRYDENWQMLSNQDERNAVACGDLTWEMSHEEITHWMPLPEPPKE